MQNIYEVLQFDDIKDKIKQYVKSVLGKQFISELKPYQDEKQLSYNLNLLDETFKIIALRGNFPISFSENALTLIEYAKKGGILSIRDLDMIGEDILTSQSLLKYFHNVDEKFTLMHSLIKRFIDLGMLEKEIHRVISKSQTINDNASPELNQIRKDLLKAEKEMTSLITSLTSKYKQYLSDENVTFRDGHYVIPIQTSYKNKISGAIYDVSSSGYTTFIEPSEVLALNNKIVSLKLQEAEEIRKILKQLTNLCVIQQDEIINNNNIIATCDFLQAKALYGQEIDGIIAGNEDDKLLLRNARHPLISKDKIVANSFSFDKDKRIIIISGPNAGGKTIALKTVALLVLMHKCGLAISADIANICYINNIYLDIGDSQSLDNNLSTFSAHISNIGEMLRLTKSKDLLLIDELGTGTDPSEGEALAISVVKYLIKKNCFAMISSHFSRLKEFAFTSENVINASMLFDEDNLKPTYIFKQGVPGQSYALEVASRYGLSKEILNEAKNHLDNIKTTDVHQLMNKLHEEALKNELLKQELLKEKENLEKQEKTLNATKKLLEEKRENLLKDVEKQKEQIIEQVKDEIDEIMDSLKSKDVKLHDVIKAKNQVNNLIKSTSINDYDETINVNDYVSVPSLNIQGKVLRINGNKAFINSSSGMSFQIEVNKLHKIEAPKDYKIKSSYNVDNLIKTNVGLSINIIGLHVDEALEQVRKYLDNCRLRGLKEVKIIHGFGSGALRKAVSGYLNSCDFVKNYKSGDEYDGGYGVTKVILK